MNEYFNWFFIVFRIMVETLDQYYGLPVFTPPTTYCFTKQFLFFLKDRLLFFIPPPITPPIPLYTTHVPPHNIPNTSITDTINIMMLFRVGSRIRGGWIIIELLAKEWFVFFQPSFINRGLLLVVWVETPHSQTCIGDGPRIQTLLLSCFQND